jgi:hypothetical protein
MATPASRPVLYLDIDDTLISWRGGSPHAAPGARDFLTWAVRLYEVRWLTTWCPGGDLDAALRSDLARMLQVGDDLLTRIRGLDWEGLAKIDGIAWLEHLVLGRPFLWVEDEYGVGEREAAFLEAYGLADCYRWCNVTERADSLREIHRELRRAAA